MRRRLEASTTFIMMRMKTCRTYSPLYEDADQDQRDQERAGDAQLGRPVLFSIHGPTGPAV